MGLDLLLLLKTRTREEFLFSYFDGALSSAVEGNYFYTWEEEGGMNRFIGLREGLLKLLVGTTGRGW